MSIYSGKLIAAGLFLAAASVNAQTVTKQIPFANQTAGIAANSFTDKIYVAAPSFGGATDSVAVVDGKD